MLLQTIRVFINYLSHLPREEDKVKCRRMLWRNANTIIKESVQGRWDLIGGFQSVLVKDIEEKCAAIHM